MKLVGSEKDELSNKEIQTKVFQNNLFHSIYQQNEKKEEFTWNVFNPDLSFIIFQLKNAKNQSVLKLNAVKVSLMRPGLRNIPLLENYNIDDKISYLLLNVKLKRISEE